MNEKKIIRKGIGISAAVVGIVVLKLLRSEGNEKYSNRWFKSISDEEFYVEREPVRQAFCRGGEGTERLLHRFNTEEADRLNKKYEKEHPDTEPRHREHGWYLPNDD